MVFALIKLKISKKWKPKNVRNLTQQEQWLNNQLTVHQVNNGCCSWNRTHPWRCPFTSISIIIVVVVVGRARRLWRAAVSCVEPLRRPTDTAFYRPDIEKPLGSTTHMASRVGRSVGAIGSSVMRASGRTRPIGPVTRPVDRSIWSGTHLRLSPRHISHQFSDQNPLSGWPLSRRFHYASAASDTVRLPDRIYFRFISGARSVAAHFLHYIKPISRGLYVSPGDCDANRGLILHYS